MVTRRPGEAVMVGDAVVVRVESVSGDKVRVSFEAPREVQIDREEVRNAILEDAIAGTAT